MSADNPPEGPVLVSRRTLLTGLAGVLASGCARVEFLAVNVPAAFGDYRRKTNIAYGTDSQHRLDIYIPKAASAVPRPLVVFWHGGRWSAGDKSDYRFVGAALAQVGYVVVIPNYRHYPQVKIDGFMEDAACAGQWAVSHAGDFGADPLRLYCMGHSSGAHMAALVALDTRYFAATGGVPRIAGVIGLSGAYDFLPLMDADMQDMFGPPQNYVRSQPIDFVGTSSPPMLLVHGLKDDVVWPKNSRNLSTALRAQGVAVTLKLYHKLGHADTVAALSTPARRWAPTLADIRAFVDRPPTA